MSDISKNIRDMWRVTFCSAFFQARLRSPVLYFQKTDKRRNRTRSLFNNNACCFVCYIRRRKCPSFGGNEQNFCFFKHNGHLKHKGRRLLRCAFFEMAGGFLTSQRRHSESNQQRYHNGCRSGADMDSDLNYQAVSVCLRFRSFPKASVS